MSNNPPEVIVELTREEAEFVIRNCDANIGLGLETLQTLTPKDRSLAERLVQLNEQFKAIRTAVRKGMGK